MMRARPWDMDETGRRQVWRALCFRHFKWDTWVAGAQTILPELMEVDEALHQEVVRTVEGLHAALGRFEERARNDSATLDRLGIPRPLHPLMAAEPERGLSCARYDLFPTTDGRLMVSEFNEDVPGGFNEAQGLPELLGDPGAGCRWEAGFRDAFVEAFRPYRRVALLYATGFAEDLQHMVILERWLQESGHGTVLGSPEHLTHRWGRHRVLGERVDAAFRFYPGEWMPLLPNFGTWRRAGASLPMMNPLRRMVRQSKIMFAAWLDDPGLDPDDRVLVERHCPRTLPFRRDEVEALGPQREGWVLKRAFGRMGDAVVMGNLATPQEWASAVQEASRAPAEWCLQERFEVVTTPFQVGPLYPTLGAFLVNGRFAGYYSRAAPRPFLTHEAFHVATVVRSA